MIMSKLSYCSGKFSVYVLVIRLSKQRKRHTWESLANSSIEHDSLVAIYRL